MKTSLIVKYPQNIQDHIALKCKKDEMWFKKLVQAIFRRYICT